MSIYSIEPPPPRNRSAEILTISLLVAIILLLAIGALLWLVRGDLVLVSTPTPTQTVGPTMEATPDVRATIIVEDMLAQETFEIALGQQTQARTVAALGTAEVIIATQQAQIQIQETSLSVLAQTPAPPEPTTTPALEFLPVSTETGTPVAPEMTSTSIAQTPVSTPLPTPTAVQVAAAPTPTATMGSETIISLPVIVSEQVPTPSTTPTSATPPTATATPTATAGPTASPTVSPTPTPSLTPTNSPTPSNYVATSLSASVRDQATAIRIGPSNPYTITANFNPGEQVNLLARSPSGEWVYTCCRDNEPGWVRQAFVTPRNNSLGSGAPEDADPNDVRWLRIEPVSSDLDPMPNPTAIPVEDYPLRRRDTHNAARPVALPRPPISQFWAYQASQSFISPVVVAGDRVLAVSADRHIYSIDRVGGNQRWRLELLDEVKKAPAIQDNLIYVVDEDGHTYAIEDRGNSAQIIWQQEIGGNPYTGITVVGDQLFLGGATNGVAALIVINRENGDLMRTYEVTQNTATLQHPTIGDQLVYVGANNVWAVDVNDNELAWERTDVNEVNAPILYVAPGRRELAEVYVGTLGGSVVSLDANTGQYVWRYEGGEQVFGLAADDTRVYVSGVGYVKGLNRENGDENWRALVDGKVMGGPIVDGNQVLVVTESGSIQFLDTNTGAPVGGSSIPAQVAGAPAVSGPWLFIAGRDSSLYAFRESQ